MSVVLIQVGARKGVQVDRLVLQIRVKVTTSDLPIFCATFRVLLRSPLTRRLRPIRLSARWATLGSREAPLVRQRQ